MKKLIFPYLLVLIWSSFYFWERHIAEGALKLSEDAVKKFLQVSNDFNYLLDEFEKCCVLSSAYPDTLWGHTFKFKDVNDSSFGVVIKPGESIDITPIIREVIMSYPRKVD